MGDAQKDKDELKKDYVNELDRLARNGVAFCPNLKSHARKFSVYSAADDDGVGIFWRKSVFKMVSPPNITVIGRDYKADSCALKVVLTHELGYQIAVVSSHLSSGDEKELRRHWELADIKKSLIDDEENAVI